MFALSDDTDERVNPYWLACFATLWLADFFIAAARVAPVLLERERRREAGAS